MMGRSPAARLAVLTCGLAALAACDRLATNLSGGVGPEAGILRGKLPGDSRGVSHVGRLTDGIAASPGDPWRTDLTAVFASPQSFVRWDLGAETPIRCALVDADGDDTYTLSVSSDGRTFAPLWSAPPDEDAGQQLRAGRGLRGAGRYLRLSAAGGDGRWSVSELSAWRECPTQWPPLAMQKGTPDDDAIRVKLWAFAALAVAYVLFYRKGAPDWARLLVVAPAGVGIALAVQLAELWPPSPALAARLLGVAAALGVTFALRRLVRRAAGRRMTPP
ncbi:MAG TPA: hypothetical protein VMT47_18025 [Polyangia bacterium]|nr:hypothetical protein [Polyangia bacterium]